MANLQGALLGMGNPLLDIIAQVPTELLEKYGLTLNNAILAEEKHLPLYSELKENFEVQYIAGGATQNSIRVAQWMLQQPGSTAFIGCVGKDDFGSQLRSCAEGDGVAVHYLEDESTSTGTCAVLVHGGERSLVANLAAANNYKKDHLLTEEIQNVINQAKFFYMSGFFLTVSPESMIDVCRHAVEHRKVVLTNLSAPFLIQVFKEPMMQVLHYADFIFSNESEAAVFAETHGWDPNDLGQVALRLASLEKASGTFPRTVVFTQGSRSTLVAREGVVTEYPVEPLDRSLLVDTNGAGDSFVGGFLSQLVQGNPISECVRAGHYAARVVIQRSGCTFPPTPDFS